MLVARQMAQERADLFGAHLRRMPLAMEVNVAADPRHVRLLGAQAVVSPAQTIPDLVEQARFERELVLSWVGRRFEQGGLHVAAGKFRSDNWRIAPSRCQHLACQTGNR